MTLETSAYQAAKLWVIAHVGMERDTFHYLIGLFLLMLAVGSSMNRLRLAPFVLALGVAGILGCAMEWADLRDDYASFGYARWAASVLDLLRTIAFPALGVILVSILRSRRHRDRE